MRINFLILFCGSFFLFFLQAESSFAKELKANFSYNVFYSPESGSYIETYLSVVGSSAEYKKIGNGLQQGEIEVSIVFAQGDKVQNFKKYKLLSPELKDTATLFPNFIDQQRFALPNGSFELEIEIKDALSSNEPFKSVQMVEINTSDDKPFFSDIQLIERFTKSENPSILTKSGYDLIPYVSNFYPVEVEKISFYSEFYNSNKVVGETDKFMFNFFVESYETSVIVNDLRKISRQSPNKVNVLLNEFSVTELPSGNYNLVVQAIDKNNQVLDEKKMFFQRSNPNAQVDITKFTDLETANTFVDRIDNMDTIHAYIQCLRPISSDLERSFLENQIKTADLLMRQKFFLNFWISRNSLAPEEEWVKYHNVVKAVEKKYGTKIRRGYETDRGRIYLKHGPPNSVQERKNEPSTYPHEIWHYYKIKNGQSNVRFIFYNTDLVTEDYVLLHSNLFGEDQDPRWQIRLQKRSTWDYNIDGDRPADNFGTRSNDYFNTPR